MSVLESFKFAVMDEKPSLLGNIKNMIGGNELAKYGDYQTTRSARPGIPSFDYSPSYTNRLWLSWCYWYEDEVSILSDILQKMRDEVVRYGTSWKPAFAKKCEICGMEYKEVVKKCEVCGSSRLRKPDKAQLRLARIDEHYTFIDRVNINDQTLQDMIKQTLLHTLVTDNGYILAHKEYHWDEFGNLISSFPREFLSMDPRDVIKLFDFETGYPGKGRVCLDHRSALLGEKDITCPICNKKTFRAYYQVFTATKTSTYYIKDEICHLMFYYPSIIYGYPKCLKIKDELISYHMIEKRVRNYYEFCKVPGILFIPTDNPHGLQEMWKKVREDTKDDPHTPAVLGVSETAPTTANFIKLIEDPNANLISVKEDLRERIASSYGITMAFTNDTSQTGGLKNDKNLISLSDRTIRSLQKFVDNKVLRWMTLSMGITDWILECEPNINDNKMEEEEVISSKLQNMEKFAAMGIQVEWKDDDYIISESDEDDGVQVQPQDANMGGMGAPAPAPPMGAQAPIPPPGPMQPPQMQPQEAPPMDTDMSSFFADAALDGDVKTPSTKKKVKSELNSLMEQLFYPERVEKRKAEEKAQQEAQEQMMNSMQAPPPDENV